MAPSSVDYFTQLLSCVIEHFQDLGVETRNDHGVEKRVETAEDNRTDNNADDDLHARVDITLCLCVGKSGLCGNCKGVCLVLDLIKKLLRTVLPPFLN